MGTGAGPDEEVSAGAGSGPGGWPVSGGLSPAGGWAVGAWGGVRFPVVLVLGYRVRGWQEGVLQGGGGRAGGRQGWWVLGASRVGQPRGWCSGRRGERAGPKGGLAGDGCLAGRDGRRGGGGGYSRWKRSAAGFLVYPGVSRRARKREREGVGRLGAECSGGGGMKGAWLQGGGRSGCSGGPGAR